MMLPVSNPKTPKRRQPSRSGLSPKVLCYTVLVLLNVAWFAYSFLASGKKHGPKAPQGGHERGSNMQPQGQAGASDDPWQSNRANGGNSRTGDGLYARSQASAHTADRRPAFKPVEGGLFQPSGSGPGSATGPDLQGGSVQDLVVKGSLTSGDLKLTGNILSSSAGKLLISAGTVAIGTSVVDPDHDKLVINGPIRITDAGPRPHCDASRRGMIWDEFGDAGQDDSVDICVKGRDEAYGWRSVLGGGPGSATRIQEMPSGMVQMAASGQTGSLVREFRVAQGSAVQPGDVVTFVEGYVKRGLTAQLGEPVIFMNAAQAAAAGGAGKRKTSLLAIAPSSCIIVHGGGAGSKSVAQVVSIHGTAVDLGASAPFGASRGDHVQMAALSQSWFLVVYSSSAEHEVGYAVMGSLSGSSLKFSPPVMMEPTGCSSLSVTALSPSTAVVAFNANSANGRGNPVVLAAQISGRTVLFGNRTTIDARLDGFVVVPLSVSTFALVYRNLRTKAAAVRVGQVRMVEAPAIEEDGEEDEELSVGAKQQAKAFLGEEMPLPTPGRILTYLEATRLSPSKLVIAYADANEGYALIANIAGNTVTPQTPVLFSRAKPLSLSLSALSETSFIISFYTNNPWRAVVVKGAVKQGNGFGSIAMFESLLTSDFSTHTHSMALSPHSFLATYYDGSNSDSGTAVAGTFGHGLGIAASAASEGEMVPVRFGGVSGDHMSLQSGACYYATDEGRTTTDETSQQVGLAVSVNEILIGGC
mmetsp:Transcript_10550/g.30038  ORF Transcript_10550/g.30038 Transcript_10550/m.30038 type:complete len:756 (+) Transcript_10550:108-2375(+)